jgi:hypothetical protein
VATDVRLIADAAERGTHVFAAEGPRDGLGDGCFAHAGRSDEEQDRAFGHRPRLGFLTVLDRLLFVAREVQRRRGVVPRGAKFLDRKLTGALELLLHFLRAELSHRQELQHAILHVRQPIVIFVEHLLRIREIEAVVRPLIPRQLAHPLEIRADDLRFHGLAPRALESAQLAIDLAPRFVGELQFRELLAQLGDLFALIVFTQFLLDGLHLLAQVHLALPLAQLLLHLRFDLFLRLDHRDLTLDVDEDASQSFFDRQRLQESLLLRDGKLDVSRDEVGEAAGIRHGVEHLVHDLLRKSPALTELRGAFANLLVQRDERGIVLVDGLHLVHGNDHGAEIAFRCRVLQRSRAHLALQQQLHTPESALDLTDARDHTHLIKNVRRRLVGVVALRDGEHESFAPQRCLDRPQRTRPTCRDRRGEPRKNHGAAQREDRQGLALSH